MLADAVAQFLIWKKWNRWFLIEGSHPDDTKLGEAYRRSAAKFGAKIVEERVFEDTGGSRRAAGGQGDLLHDPFEYLTPLSSGNLKRSHLFHVYETILVNRWRRI